MSDAAELALVSPATAYRYFPSAQALWQEATFELVSLRWDPAVIDEGGGDVGARLERAITTLGWYMLDEEAPFRLRTLTALELWFEQRTRPELEHVPVREGRRMTWIARVLEPLRGRLPDERLDGLGDALALVLGPEALISLRDVCRLETDEAKATMLQAARWLLAGALADLGIADEGPRPSAARRRRR